MFFITYLKVLLSEFLKYILKKKKTLKIKDEQNYHEMQSYEKELYLQNQNH